MNTINIFLTDLNKYNEGSLVGEWIELPIDEDTLNQKINKYSQNRQTDYFISDYEKPELLPHLEITEYTDPTKLNSIAEQIANLSEEDLHKLDYLLDQLRSFEDAIERINDVIFYPNMSLKDLAYEFVEEGRYGNIPEYIKNYIDYEAISRDLDIDGYCENKHGVFYIDY